MSSQSSVAKVKLLKDARRHAKAVSLRWVSDDSPGIGRRGKGRYVDARGRVVRDKGTLARIKSLVIPPAWTDVWICPKANGHLQATGKDARGRKQYKYHTRFREAREETKYEKMIAFARALPKIRRRVGRDLARKHLPRAKVLAAVTRLLETTLIRVGNDEYARNNDSYGLTTLKDRHAKIGRKCVRFEFNGKSGIEHEIDLCDPRLAKIARQCQELPGQELFQYLDEDGKVRDITSSDVNQYVREIAGDDFTAKDFRTWAGTVLAAMALRELEAFDSQAQAKRNIVAAVEKVAARLGNTRAVCRKCYIHPEIIDSYLDGTLKERLAKGVEKRLTKDVGKLRAEEAMVLTLLRGRLRR